MQVSKYKTPPYKAGKNKGLSVNQAKCSANGYIIMVSETIGSKEIGLSFSSSQLCTASSIDDGINIARKIFEKFDKPNYMEMVLFANDTDNFKCGDNEE